MDKMKQRIAIAEACGWTDVRELDDVYPDGSVAAGIWWQGVNPSEKVEDLIPDYINDLNAMHEAEKVLGDKLDVYTLCLYHITKGGDKMAYRATAAQRAEAFLKTIGKWEE